MTFFESLLALLFAAIMLLQVSRRAGLPYPAMLALAGVAVAFVPGAPTIALEPQTVLALFIAPALLDAAFDFPINAAWTLWRPIAALAVVAVLATAAAVAWVGVAYAGLPLGAAIVLGAIVSPPDAAATTAVLGAVALPKRTTSVLKGESLFNDATALMLFNGSLAAEAHGGFDGTVALGLAVAVPGGIVLGIVAALAMRWMNGFVSGTLGGNILQFVNAFAVWIVAEHLHLSAVLAVVACAMTLARSKSVVGSARMRVHSYAVWSTVVFLLNALAFLLMGMQARGILLRLYPDRLGHALAVAGAVLVAAVVSRFVVVMAWNRLAARFGVLRGGIPAPTLAQGWFVAWSGMRGLLTMATAFALPADFPQRDTVVLAAFAIVLVTLVGQGLTLTPLIRWLKLDRMEDPDTELRDGRAALASAGCEALADDDSDEAGQARRRLDAESSAHGPDGESAALERYHRADRTAIDAQRVALQRLRDDAKVDDDTYLALQEELDWRELTVLPDDERRIAES